MNESKSYITDEEKKTAGKLLTHLQRYLTLRIW